MGEAHVQVGHAVLKVLFDRGWITREVVCNADGHWLTEEGAPTLIIPLTEDMATWCDKLFAKIVLSVENEADLLRVHELALEANIPTALILDAGRTEFKKECPDCEGTGEVHPVPAAIQDGFPSTDCEVCEGTGKVGVPTHTTVSLGPARVEDIDRITGPGGLVTCKLA